MLETLAVRAEARRTLQAFTSHTTPLWHPGRMHRTICDQLDRVMAGEIDRLMLLCPPQHGKSSIASKRFPAFALGRDPALDVISASATADLAEEFGRDVRNCINSNEYGSLFPKTRLSEDTTAKGRWRTTENGGYYAIGVGGSIFGRGGNGIIDDPFASWEDAQSELQRDRVWDWYRGSFLNRIRPGNWIIVINHRMHQEDLTGRLIEQMNFGGDQWEIVELPATIGDPPWAERYNAEALERLKASMSPLMWSALYMQQPTPEEGTFFKREWFKRFNPAKLTGVYKYGSGDFAVSHERGDWTDIGINGYGNGGNLYLALDWWWGRTTADVWIDRLCEQFERHRPFAFFGESGVIRRSVEPYLIRRMHERNCYTRLEWLARPHDKATMARGLQGLAAQGKVHIADTEGGERVLASLLRFPTGKPDDPADAAALMGMALDQAHPAILSPTPAIEKPKDDYRPVNTGGDIDQWRVA